MIRELEHTDKRLYLTLLVNFSLMGGVVTLFGAALAKVIESYGWSYTDAGTIYAASSVGFFTSSLATGFLIDHFGWKSVLVIGLVAEAISLMFFARTGSVPINVALYFIVGLGLGSNEAITNAVVVRVEERGKSRLMNLMHAFWCIGAVLGPLGIANLIREQGNWQIVFPVFGVLILVMTALLALQHFPTPEAALRRDASRRTEEGWHPDVSTSEGVETDSPEGAFADGSTDDGPPAAGRAGTRGRNGSAARGPSGFRALLASKTGSFVLLCALSIFVYIGVEKGVYSWVSEFFVTVLGSSVSLGAAMVALYWTGQFLGRLGISIVYRGSRLELVLISLCALTVGALLALVFVRVIWIAILCTFVAGLANSGIFPLVISLTGKYSVRGRSVGFVTSAGGMAGFLFPLLVASISDAAGMARGFESVFIISVVLLAVSLVVVARVRRMDRDELPSREAEVRSA